MSKRSVLFAVALTPVACAVGDEFKINARNDVPGPVHIVVQVLDEAGVQLNGDVTLIYDDNDNTWQTGTFHDNIEEAATIRLTYIDDFCGPGCPGDPDDDRNAHIDFFELNASRVEAEDFIRTGGTDGKFPGCEVATLDGRTVVTCGNEGDWVEYDAVCSRVVESFAAKENNHVNVLNATATFSQSFVLDEDSDLCEVGIKIDPGPATGACPGQGSITVKIESPLDTVLTSGTISGPFPEHRFYDVTVDKIMLNADQEYFVRVFSDPVCVHRWCNKTGLSDPYPNGQAHVAGVPVMNSDFLFVTTGWNWHYYSESGGGGGLQRVAGTGTVFSADGNFIPGAALILNAVTPTSMIVKKVGIEASVDLLQASINIVINPAIEVDANGNEYSGFVIASGNGQFDSYLFGTSVVGVSTFDATGGSGSIWWNNGSMTATLDVVVEAAGFADLKATAIGSGRISFNPGNDSVEMLVDARASEFGFLLSPIPAVSEWGVAVLVLLLLGVGTVVFKRGVTA